MNLWKHNDTESASNEQLNGLFEHMCLTMVSDDQRSFMEFRGATGVYQVGKFKSSIEFQ